MNIVMTCGWAGCEVEVTPEQWESVDFVPCPSCPEGGVDLIHARYHADDLSF